MATKNSHQYEYEFFQKLPAKMAYDGTMPFDQWQKRARACLEALLGLPLQATAPLFTIEYEKDFEDFHEVRFLFESEPGYTVPCHFLVPHGDAQSFPLTICASGHGGGMHVALGRAKTPSDEQALFSWPHRAMALRAIADGRCALVIETRNFGECSLSGYGTTCTEAGKIALLSGRTLLGLRVWDVQRALDVVLEQFPIIDASDIVMTGNSGGGTTTYYTACLDERITVAAPSCSVCTFESSIAAMPHCLCNHVPGIRRYFEMGDMAGMIAPRILVMATGRLDTGFPLEGAQRAFEQAQRAYRAAGVPDRCAFIIGEGGHLNYADEIWAKIATYQSR